LLHAHSLSLQSYHEKKDMGYEKKKRNKRHAQESVVKKKRKRREKKKDSSYLEKEIEETDGP
jgi:hypothetical protein